ncbi:MAG: hypothetical protein QXX94_07805 [Candidatus Bathyarchaeia archaeon]
MSRACGSGVDLGGGSAERYKGNLVPARVAVLPLLIYFSGVA